MNLTEFTDHVISRGIEAAREDYKDSPDRLKGSLAGFEACRGKSPQELYDLLLEAARDSLKAHNDRAKNYWEFASKSAEIEWVVSKLRCWVYPEVIQ